RTRVFALHPAIKFGGLCLDLRVALGVDEVEFLAQGDSIGSINDLVAHGGGKLNGFCLHLGKERIAIVKSTAQVRFGAHHWVGLSVCLFFFFRAVLRWIVGGGVGTHTVCVGFYQHRTLAAAGVINRAIHNGCCCDG